MRADRKRQEGTQSNVLAETRTYGNIPTGLNSIAANAIAQ